MFTKVIKAARNRVVNEYEKCLRGNCYAGAIFALKNIAGWTDRNTLEGDKEKPLVINLDVKASKV